MEGKNIEQLQAEVAQLQEEKKAIQAELELTIEINKELQQKLQEATDVKAVTSAQVKETPSIEGKQFTVDGKSYGFNFPKQVWKKTPITVDAVLADTKLQGELVQERSSMIREL
jgi:hypothetical protein